MALKKTCPKCGKIISISEKYCSECMTNKKGSKTYDKRRGTSTQRGYDTRWRKARLSFLRKYPLCADCLKDNKLTPATVVDHIIAHKGNKKLFWDESNWQPLCESCHNRKTASQDMGKWQ